MQSMVNLKVMSVILEKDRKTETSQTNRLLPSCSFRSATPTKLWTCVVAMLRQWHNLASWPKENIWPYLGQCVSFRVTLTWHHKQKKTFVSWAKPSTFSSSLWPPHFSLRLRSVSLTEKTAASQTAFTKVTQKFTKPKEFACQLHRKK